MPVPVHVPPGRVVARLSRVQRTVALRAGQHQMAFCDSGGNGTVTSEPADLEKERRILHPPELATQE